MKIGNVYARASDPGGGGGGRCFFQAPELPDNTPIDHVRFGSRIRNALNAASRKATGEVRETSADALLSLPGLGSGPVARLREALSLSSTDGVRPKCKKP
jgi:DNA-directed RNA polymerase alpha subunit